VLTKTPSPSPRGSHLAWLLAPHAGSDPARPTPRIRGLRRAGRGRKSPSPRSSASGACSAMSLRARGLLVVVAETALPVNAPSLPSQPPPTAESLMGCWAPCGERSAGPMLDQGLAMRPVRWVPARPAGGPRQPRADREAPETPFPTIQRIMLSARQYEVSWLLVLGRMNRKIRAGRGDGFVGAWARAPGERRGANRRSATMRPATPPAAAERVKETFAVARCSDGHDVATVARALAARTAADRVAMS
jgi:hypothetical protein